MSLAIVIDALIFLSITGLAFGIMMLTAARRPAPVSLSVRRGNALDRVMSMRISDSFIPEKESERGALRLFLLQAGFDSPKAVQTYFGMRIAAAVCLATAMLFASTFFPVPPRLLYLFVLLAGFVGYMLPDYLLRFRRGRRQLLAREAFPDMLDLFLVCTEAGLGIDTAIARVGEELALTHPLLSEHLRQVGMELRAGKSRADAMRVLADRTGIEEAISLVNLLVQSDVLGTSMAATLRAFSEDMRAKRLLKAEEMGHKVSVKLTLILIFCFLPGVMIAIMTPVVFKVIEAFSHFGTH